MNRLLALATILMIAGPASAQTPGSAGSVGGYAEAPLLAKVSEKMSEPTFRTDKVQIDSARKALEAFKSACSPLFTKHADDIVEIKVAVNDGWSPRAREWGWGAEISVEVILRDRTQTFSDPRASGHHLWYILGGGPKPGFLVMKRISQEACGLPVLDDRPDVFIDVPELAELLPRSEPVQSHPDCTIEKVLIMAEELTPSEIGRGWRGDRQAPWQLGYAKAALSACGFSKGPRWPELEQRAAIFRHQFISNAELVKQGQTALLKDTMGVGMTCQCALAIQHFGPRGLDLDGILEVK